jgi:hypothetical protein
MNKLVIDTKNDKMRDFLRYVENQEGYFTSDDTLAEIHNSKNIWAGFAYQVFLEKYEGKELSNREENFLNAYFEKYILSAKELTKLEKDLKGLYLKHRLSDDYPLNHVLNENKEPIYPVFENGVKEYATTIEGLVSLIMGEDIKVEVVEKEEGKTTKDLVYNDKTKTFTLDKKFIEDVYYNMLTNYYSITDTFQKVHEMCIEVELAKLNKVKKEDISLTALVYTMEDYLYSKGTKNTKVSKAYAELFDSIIANKQIDLDAREAALLKICSANWLYSDSEYKANNPIMRGYLNDELIKNNNAPHIRRDARFLSGVEYPEEVFVTMFNMYVNGLKTMPKTKLTNVTKYFAINGNALTVLDMGLILKEYDSKIVKAKDDEEKQIKLEIEKGKVKKVLKYIKDTVPSYKIEEKLLKLVTQDLAEEDAVKLDDEIISDCISNYGAYQDMKYRIEHMYNQLDNLASSNSLSKINFVRSKEKVLSNMIDKFSHIDTEINDFLYRLGSEFEFESPKTTLVITKQDDMNKILSAIQELMGRGIVTSEKMIESSIKNGTPVLRNLTPGFKKFAEDLLAAKGVKEFKKKKSIK